MPIPVSAIMVMGSTLVTPIATIKDAKSGLDFTRTIKDYMILFAGVIWHVNDMIKRFIKFVTMIKTIYNDFI